MTTAGPAREGPAVFASVRAPFLVSYQTAESVKHMGECNPVLVEVCRGDRIESRHRGACAVVAAGGALLRAWGDVERPVYPRSAIKPVQALSLLETGAADRFSLDDEEIALACASHNGEEYHRRRVLDWLARIGLSERDLECGPHDSINPEVTRERHRRHVTAGAAMNNCSGKHAGFLTTALHMGEPVAGYIRPDHPVQKRVTGTIEAMAGVSLSSPSRRGIDGCGIPTFAMPLVALARALARMLADDLPERRRLAAARILGAMARHPHCVAGTDRFDTRVIRQSGGRIITKTGAEGVYIAMIPAAGLAVALKIDDGARRASETAMITVLDGLGLLDEKIRKRLADLMEPVLVNTLNEPVGRTRRGRDLVFDH